MERCIRCICDSLLEIFDGPITNITVNHVQLGVRKTSSKSTHALVSKYSTGSLESRTTEDRGYFAENCRLRCGANIPLVGRVEDAHGRNASFRDLRRLCGQVVRAAGGDVRRRAARLEARQHELVARCAWAVGIGREVDIEARASGKQGRGVVEKSLRKFHH